jgi:hypothetical protein
MKEICFPNVKFSWFQDAVAIVCCWGVAGGVCGSCFFSAITGLVDEEEELLAFVVEPFHEEFVGVEGALAAVATGVEGF